MKERTNLERFNADVVSLIDKGGNVERIQSPRNHRSVDVPFKFESWNKDTIIRVPQVLSFTKSNQ